MGPQACAWGEMTPLSPGFCKVSSLAGDNREVGPALINFYASFRSSSFLKVQVRLCLLRKPI